ncbi:TIGR01906 family membrane protein [Clostridium sp. DJ247]|nr:TIGR01906 family membrane protein [Clostridium sp. DJ247]
MKILFNAVFAISMFLFIVIFSVKITLNFKALYYFDLNYLNIKKYTFLNDEQIKSTYSYIIDYVTNYKTSEFHIPLLPSSKEGITHFIDVKNLVHKLDFLLFICTMLVICSIYFYKKYKDLSFLNWCSNILLCTCSVIILAFSLSFDKSFTAFHKLFFNNNYWLLDPNKDPVINILPEEYFFHCAILILIIIFLWIVAIKLIYFKHKKMIGRK